MLNLKQVSSLREIDLRELRIGQLDWNLHWNQEASSSKENSALIKSDISNCNSVQWDFTNSFIDWSKCFDNQEV